MARNLNKLPRCVLEKMFVRRWNRVAPVVAGWTIADGRA
jgi:hypothetical protein